MALQVRNLFFGLLGAMLTACVAGAQVDAGMVQSKTVHSNLRFPVTPLQLTGAPQSTVEEELHQMSTQAEVIFAGQVMAVQRQADAGWVEVMFHVEHAIRGCAGQDTYKLREWAGLWTGGKERYRVGQQLLMMLHAPSASGLSSPVGGQDGAIPIMGLGVAPKPGDAFTDAGEQAVDLRWLKTRVLRSGSLSATEPTTSSSSQQMPKAQSATGKSVDMLSREAPLNSVLAMLGAWEAQQADAAR